MNAISYIKTQDGNKNIQDLKDKLFKAAPDFEHAIITDAATIATLEADKAKLIEALVKAESALTYANWDGEFDDTHTSQDVINARDEARRVLVEVKGQTK